MTTNPSRSNPSDLAPGQLGRGRAENQGPVTAVALVNVAASDPPGAGAGPPPRPRGSAARGQRQQRRASAKLVHGQIGMCRGNQRLVKALALVSLAARGPP
jgi:hypothetical protein